MLNRRTLLKTVGFWLAPAADYSDRRTLEKMLDHAGIDFEGKADRLTLKVDGDTVTGVAHETCEFHFTKRGRLQKIVLWSTDFDNTGEDK